MTDSSNLIGIDFCCENDHQVKKCLKKMTHLNLKAGAWAWSALCSVGSCSN